MIVQSIIFTIFISGSLLGAVYFDRKFEELLPAHLMVTMLILYVCGLSSKLQLGVYVVLLFNIILYIVSIVVAIRRKNIRNVINNLLTPAFLIFTLIFCVFTYADLEMKAHSWDEFSHWVDCVKGMTYVNDFVTNPKASAAFQSYPPAMALMQYLVSRIYLMVNRGAEFNEWRVYCYRPPIMSSNRYCILSRRQQFCQGKYTRFWQIHGTTVAQARNAHGKTNAINPSYGYAATKNRKRHRSDSNFGMMPSVFCR